MAKLNSAGNFDSCCNESLLGLAAAGELCPLSAPRPGSSPACLLSSLALAMIEVRSGAEKSYLVKDLEATAPPRAASSEAKSAVGGIRLASSS